MVHRYICIGNLSPEFTASILNTKGRYTTGMRAAHYLLIWRRNEVTIFVLNFYSTLDRSGYGGIWSSRRSSRRWRHGIANETKRWVPSIRKKVRITPKMSNRNINFSTIQKSTVSQMKIYFLLFRLPEFKFWYSATKATVIAFVCTFFDFFNIPVFWPILVMYFITLFCITMKRQIKVSFI